MYYCTNCKKLSRARESAHKVVTIRRPMKYYGEDRETGAKIVVGEGWEAAQEATMCRECAAPYYAANQES